MKKTIILIFSLCLWLSIYGNTDDWTGNWMISYDAYFNNGWIFQEVKFKDDGRVYINVDGKRKIAGRWAIEEIVPKGSVLIFRLLKFEIWENEFIILYGNIENKHIGRALISDRKSNWPMHPIEFEIKKITY